MKPLRIRSLIAISALLAFSSSAVPTLVRQPAPLTNSVSFGASLTNRVLATTTNPPAVYQWQLDGTPLTDQTNSTLVLTNIQLSNGGSYVVVVADADGSVSSQPWVVNVDAAFTKITSGPVVSTSSSAAAWGDINNDGFPDLYLAVSGGPNVLCTNRGDGTFGTVTGSPLVSASSFTFSCAWADVDNNGTLDLLRAAYNGNDQLFSNNGNGTFVLVPSPTFPSSGSGANNCVWGDFDNDGFVDLFVANGYGSTQNTLFHNNANGAFTRVTNSVILPSGGKCLGASWGDYDNDGYLDLVVTRNGASTLLFHNNRDGTFRPITNVITSEVVASGTFSGPSWGDYDNDGFLDLFIAGADGKGPGLYHNEGDGSFTRVTNSAISSATGSLTGGAWADYDNDGYLDLFIANQHLQTSYLFHNEGDGTFSRVRTGSLVNDASEGQGAAWADFNNDGFPDLVVPNIRSGIKNFLYRNNGNSNHWLTVNCLGRVSNRAAIGAKVRVQALLRGNLTWQLREISGGGSLGSQNDLRAQFGLGRATEAAVVRIEWPSGIVQQLTNVPANQFLTVREPPKLAADIRPTAEGVHLTLTGGKGVVYSLESSTDLASWSSIAILTNQTGTVSWTNQFDTQAAGAFFRAGEL